MKTCALFAFLGTVLLPLSLHAGAEYLTSQPESIIPVAQSTGSATSNSRWYRLGEEDSREFNHRDVGLLFTPESADSVSRLGVQLIEADKVAGGGAPGAAARVEVFELASPEDRESPGEPVAKSDFQLPQESAPAGGWLVIDFPKVEMRKGKTYLFLLSFTDDRPGQWIDIATMRAAPQSSVVFRNIRGSNPPVWTQSKGQFIYLLGNPH